MVLAMPRVKSKGILEIHGTYFRMTKRALPLFRSESPQQPHPAIVQGVEKCERDVHRSCLRVGEFSPGALGVGLDRRIVFGQREFESHVSIQMAVGDMMRDLADGPSAIAVGGV